ncbi:hypothetical protein [Nocardioides sp. TF02-7]|uniref:hypothetical protein n=1 Tax=Nocardioides sp. TF02-7 TaxID=2917724 RepID=UPI001F060D8E|nr:hypothetical protein [Nocardioides sp. TF02-7]UMG93229.1 hypothetical protein MF408_02720 [Nocardioides sp. TF02-7]
MAGPATGHQRQGRGGLRRRRAGARRVATATPTVGRPRCPSPGACPGACGSGWTSFSLSFYETACSPRARPTAAQIAATLRSLQRIFPRALVGIGEVGAQGRADGLPRDPTFAEKERIARRYLGMHDRLRQAVGRRFIGGYFWWYYATDAVPRSRPGSLWPVLESLYADIRAR